MACKKIPALSMVTEPTAAVVDDKSLIRHNCCSESTSTPILSVTWIAVRRALPTNASTKTPITAPANTISIGASNE